MSIESALALAIATFIFAIIPGPGITATIAHSLSRGFRSGVAFSAGLVLGDMLYLCMALFGLGFIAAQVGPLFVFIKWAGAAYLIYLGIKCWRAKPPVQEADSCPVPIRHGASFWAGLSVTLGNPKVIAFYCGFLPGFVNMPRLTGADIALVVAIMLPIIFLVPVTCAWLAARGRQAICSPRTWKIANRSAGAIMIGAGIAIAAE